MAFHIPASARSAAYKFLGGFPAGVVHGGMAYFMGGAVQELEALGAGVGFSGEVSGSQVYQTTVAYDEKRGVWSGRCSCALGVHCKHIYALMKAVLVAPIARAEEEDEEEEAVEVGSKRAGTAGSSSRAAATKGGLEGMLAEGLGRALSKEERRYCEAVNAAYQSAHEGGIPAPQDLKVLGVTFESRNWDRLELWAKPPMDEREFWLHMLVFLEERHGIVPESMQVLGDPGPAREKVAQWRRTREVDRWSRLLGNLREDAAEVPGREVDLRLRFLPQHVAVEWKRAGDMDFEPMKLREFRDLSHIGPDRMVEEAALLSRWLVERGAFGFEPTLPYQDPETREILAEVLRLPWLASRLVGEGGLPLQRPEEPLRWQVEPASGVGDDYRLRIVDPEGALAGPFLHISKGHPNLYLTGRALWRGPEVDERVIDPGVETRIPAQALESGHGVRLLRRMGVELPQRLRERVKTVEVRPRMRCTVQPTWAGSSEESCLIEVRAESEDGELQLAYTPQGWRSTGRSGAPDESTYYDRSALARVAVLLEPLPLKWDDVRLHWHFKLTRKFAETFAAWLHSLPAGLALDLEGELASFREAPLKGAIRLEVEEAELDWFDLKVVLDVADTQLTKPELKLLLDARGGWVRLEEKGWRRLEFAFSQEDDEQLARLGLSAQELSSEPQRLHALQIADKAARRFLPAATCERIERRRDELKTRVTPEVPEAIQAQLRPYQLDGFHFLAYLSTNGFGGVLADDMGLGKTVQTLTWLAWLRGRSGGRSLPSLVVCPKSVCDNWQAEAQRFLPGFRVRVWAGGELSQVSASLEEADLHVINYAQLRAVGGTLAEASFLAVVLDEGQFIKNPGSATAQIARSLKAEHRLVLSGTPIENRLLDLWSLMSFAMPGALGSRAQFAKLYGSKEDPYAHRRLSARVRPFVLRRTKGQVATDLPDRIEEDLHCAMEGEQQTLYRAELKRAQQMLLQVTTQKQLAGQRFHVLSSLLRLRQICCDPRLVAPASKAPSAKLEALLEQLEPLMEQGQKVLVFSQFVQMLDLLKEAISKRNWPLFYLAGKTENRGDLVREFQASEGPSVFLISLKAGGFGLNLTAASYVVLFDPWWNPAVENQAIDRTHRIGQANKVVAYRLLIKNSIEEKIRTLQTRKRALAEGVLGEEQFAQSLTLEDLRELFAE